MADACASPRAGHGGRGYSSLVPACNYHFGQPLVSQLPHDSAVHLVLRRQVITLFFIIRTGMTIMIYPLDPSPNQHHPVPFIPNKGLSIILSDTPTKVMAEIHPPLELHLDFSY